MEDYVTRHEHEEFMKRLEQEDSRQNHRLELIEADVKEINDLTLSVNRLAVTMEQMLKEQQDQGARIKNMEEQPAKNWNTIKVSVITCILTAIITAAITAIITIL